MGCVIKFNTYVDQNGGMHQKFEHIKEENATDREINDEIEFEQPLPSDTGVVNLPNPGDTTPSMKNIHDMADEIASESSQK